MTLALHKVGQGRVNLRKARPTAESLRAARRLADVHKASFRRAYVAGLDAMASPEDIEAIAVAIRNKSLIAVEQRFPVYNKDDPDSAAAWAHMKDQFEAAYQALVEASGKQELARMDLPLSFNLSNPYSVDWIDRKTTKLITDLSFQAKTNIQGLIRSSFTDGLTVDQLKPLIRAQITLTPREAQAVDRRYQSGLAQGMLPDRAAGIMEAYTSKLMDVRAERIARTETIAAEAAGQRDAWKAARDEGLIQSGTQREWIGSSQSNGACRVCAALDGKRVGLDEAWVINVGGKMYTCMLPPIHCNCRCTQVLIASTSQSQVPEQLDAPDDGLEKALRASLAIHKACGSFAKKDGGPGSRGGKVIGTYPDGSPKYARRGDATAPKPATATAMAAPTATKTGFTLPEPHRGEPHLAVRALRGDGGNVHIDSVAEAKAINQYQGMGFADINEGLRKGHLGETTQAHVQHIDTALEAHEVVKDVTVYRGLNLTNSEISHKIRGLRAGDTLSDKAYTSTTTSREAVDRFLLSEGQPGVVGRAVFHIKVAKGSKALPVEAAAKHAPHGGGFEKEKELLLPRSTTLHVKHVRRVKDVLHVTVEARRG